jgi:hypothetical protein
LTRQHLIGHVPKKQKRRTDHSKQEEAGDGYGSGKCKNPFVNASLENYKFCL